MDKILAGLDGVVSFLDDFVCYGKDLNEHNSRLESLFQRLRQANLRLNREKCDFAKNEIEYCGYIVSSKGIFKRERNDSVIDFPTPKCITDVRSFCGLVNYYTVDSSRTWQLR